MMWKCVAAVMAAMTAGGLVAASVGAADVAAVPGERVLVTVSLQPDDEAPGAEGASESLLTMRALVRMDEPINVTTLINGQTLHVNGSLGRRADGRVHVSLSVENTWKEVLGEDAEPIGLRRQVSTELSVQVDGEPQQLGGAGSEPTWWVHVEPPDR